MFTCSFLLSKTFFLQVTPFLKSEQNREEKERRKCFFSRYFKVRRTRKPWKSCLLSTFLTYHVLPKKSRQLEFQSFWNSEFHSYGKELVEFAELEFHGMEVRIPIRTLCWPSRHFVPCHKLLVDFEKFWNYPHVLNRKLLMLFRRAFSIRQSKCWDVQKTFWLSKADAQLVLTVLLVSELHPQLLVISDDSLDASTRNVSQYLYRWLCSYHSH